MLSVDLGKPLKHARLGIVLESARRKYPNNSLRLQPLPNQISSKIYQLHIRARSLRTEHDSVWCLVKQGTLEEIEECLQQSVD